MKILIKFAPRGDFDAFFRIFGMWHARLTAKRERVHEVRFLLSLDDHTPALAAERIYPAFRAHYPEVELVYGPAASPVIAANRDLEQREFDVLVLASAEMIPELPDFDQVIGRLFEEHYPDFDGALHFEDASPQSESLCTVPVIGRRLLARLGQVLHPSYTDLTAAALDYTESLRILRARQPVPLVLARRISPAGKPPEDQMALLEARRKAHFGLPATFAGSTLWSIMIPTLKSRRQLLNKLLEQLYYQIDQIKGGRDMVEVLTCPDNGEKPVGAKRNWLVAKARGLWGCFIDDDDDLSPYYVADILKAMKDHPQADTLVFDVMMFRDQLQPRRFYFDLEHKEYEDFSHYSYRTPNHLSPTKLEIMRQVPFQEVNRGEDIDYARRVKPLLRTQHKINKTLYYYMFSSIGTATSQPGT